MTGYLIQDEAKADLLDIWNAASRRILAAADKQLDEFYAQFETIVSNPDIGRWRDALAPGLQDFIYGKYHLFYRVAKNEIRIVRVIHGARDLSKIVFE